MVRDLLASFRPSAAMLLTAALLDVVFGEPPNAIHPVVWMGELAAALRRLSPEKGRAAQLAAGLAIALVVPAIFSAASWLVLALCSPWPALRFAFGTLVLKSTFSVRALGAAATAVRDALGRGEVAAARAALRRLCSRDAAALSAGDLVGATIESVAENTSDSFVAPLFYYALLGLPGAVFYRAVNTLDAMIGYHGEFEYLGKTAARMDDLLNLVPARLTAGLLLLAAWLHRDDARRGWRIVRRDGAKTESPNAGRPIAAMAGILGVELEKKGHYRLGEPIEQLAIEKIDAAWSLATLAAGMALMVCAVVIGIRNACAS